MSVASKLPKLISIWPDFGQSVGLTRGQSYSAANQMPAGVKVQIGGRVLLNEERLLAYLRSGGDLAAR